MSPAPAALSGRWCYFLSHQRLQKESWRPLSAPNHSGISYKIQILASLPCPRMGELLTSQEPHFCAATVAGPNSGPYCCGEAPWAWRGGVSCLPTTDLEMFLSSEATTEPHFLPRCSSSVHLRILSPCHGVMCSPDWRCSCPYPWLQLSGLPHPPWPCRAADFPQGLYHFSECKVVKNPCCEPSKNTWE